MGLYSVYHIIYIAIYVVLIALSILACKFLFKTDKSRGIYMRVLGGLLFASLIVNRISLTVWDNNAIGIREMIPNTYCGMSSLLLGIVLMTGKRDIAVYHFLWWLELVGGIACVFYPTFINQGPSFFFLTTITGLNHHALGTLICIKMVYTKWNKPSFKYWYAFPIGIAAYTLFGLFLIDVLKIFHTMIIDEPAVPKTPLKWWFILIFGSAAVAVITFGIDKIKYALEKRAIKKPL